MGYEVIVVGGSFAGLSAAMQLARARRKVLLIDARKPRNRFAETSHGFLGQDGKSPETIRALAARQLAAYPTVTQVEGEVTDARKTKHGFEVCLADGEEVGGRRIILATGMRDELPDLPGLRERWGKTVLHCPYCHGYEVADREIGVLASSPHSVHQAGLLPDWGPTTYFTQGEFEPDDQQIAFLQQRRVTIVRSPVLALTGLAPTLEAVLLEDGSHLSVGALFVAPKTHLASPLAERLGCAMDEGPMGPVIQVDQLQRTSVAGVFAAGDAAMPMANATLAAAAGAKAGFSTHQSLVFPQ